MRSLTFSDDKDNEEKWAPGDPRSAPDAFREFVGRHRAEDNATFCIEDEENEEALLLMFDAATICRVKGAENSRVEYRLVTNGGDYRSQVANFVRGGSTALDRGGPWWPDVAALDRARLRFVFDESLLRRTHPRELRRRLEVLTRIDGREPSTAGGVTHFGFGNGGGDTVNAWFTAEGRGLVVTFDHTSPLNFYEDPQAQAALYDGVPADLLALVTEADTTLEVSHPDGGTLVAATGVFTFSGPCAMADGLVLYVQEARLGVEDTGAGWLLEGFLAPDEFTPAAVAEAVAWWSAEDIARGFAAAGERELPAPFDQETVDRFCKIWADSGYNDRWDVHYVLFDGYSVEDAGEDRDELLSSIRTLGLERVDAPPGAADGEVWVRTDPRIDAELGNWA
ncbi:MULTISPECIES: DUF6357 family protein [Amycolatopsis]|uniref:DUF6357 family protein n=1 Tax=Amycolatopsis TaxID=1813 RepID=UPI001C78D90D|nr:DUF6357 family protein [Amycolatopsis sp. TNS106]QXV63395.1 hypothetical protein CVV72_35325 [Amycolatopsis sp. TNS106]